LQLLKRLEEDTMSYKEPDHEAVVVQKLKEMEEQLESFMSEWGGPLKKAERFVDVHAPVGGKITWHRWDGPVKEHEPIFEIRHGVFQMRQWIVESPADGTLEVFAGPGEVSKGWRIARIWLKEIRI
jgi:hypothetical protein